MSNLEIEQIINEAENNEELDYSFVSEPVRVDNYIKDETTNLGE